MQRQTQHDLNRDLHEEGLGFNQAEIIPTPPPLPAPLVVVQPRARPTITSATYKRVAATSIHCIFANCHDMERLMIPKIIREMCLLRNKLYIPACARVCRHHLNNGAWSDLTSDLNDFTSSNFDAILNIMSKGYQHTFNFGNVELMPPHLCHYWLGKTHEEFEELMLCVPSLIQYVKCPSLAMCIYLVKLRTGESNDRLATLFKMSRSTLEYKMAIARRCLTEEFVPRHIGFAHMNAEQVAARNTIIADGLFGNPNLPVDVKPAIVMCDATYIYVQSSSNYKFQKETYSLQKSDNLVKPFMIVCCDGYIIDCLGPYRATTNDATITRVDLLKDESRIRDFFRQGDIFILDKGFRDVILLLEEFGFQAKMPESRLDGEHQLTTLQANNTRFVTMCRWVVEIVNGRIKRDFRIFRDVYNNRAAGHLKEDLMVVCALINKFHQPIEDPPEAREYVEIARRRLNLPNYLADFVDQHNLNMRRAMFASIDGDNPQLNGFPKLTIEDLKQMALGTYQIKQARSYYGEHVRASGTYTVEVNTEIEDDVPLILGLNNYLVRGRIKSRHIGGRTYFVYILVSRENNIANTLNAIVGYCCNCQVGRRTVGCCAHIMTVVWYLSWGRYNDINAPAPLLDMFFEEEI